MRLTPWYPGTIQPVRAGVYQSLWDGNIVGYRHWNNVHWGAWSHNKNDAYKLRHIKAAQNDNKWRGLTEAA